MSPLRSLTNRIFLANALLTALSIGAALFFVRARLMTELQLALDRDLRTAANVVDQQQAALFETFTRSASLLADLPRFKAAVDTGDAPTVQPIAEDYLRQLGADVLDVRGQRGERLASAASGRRGVLRVVTVPIRLDLEHLGALTAGYVLDNDRAAELKVATGAEIAFGADGRILASTLGAAAEAPLFLLQDRPAQGSVEIEGTEYVALVRPLPSGAPGQPRAAVVVMHSRTDRLQTLSAIQTFLLSLAAGAVLLAVAIAYGVARTMTRPLARITDHMRQLAASGDLTRKVTLSDQPGWVDEDAQVLAGTFNSLTDAITRFQHEAAQRERLSALGRLSTVIAHEVRNPLMIIKGALRTLTRPGASPVDVADAAGDINEEIARLNRLVNDVLDFARPIQVEADETDVNAICEDAARAVSSNGAPQPTLTLASGLPTVRTDRERLRTALINLLTNAQEAVGEVGPSAAGPDGGAGVTLETAAGPGGRVAIAVRDRGPGIGSDDLPRIFDPYFTTRRGGTGLGLAITRNIVDGLGGTLAVARRPGGGTEFRLEIGPIDAEPPARQTS
jgi:signal transduction histidine kinase